MITTAQQNNGGPAFPTTKPLDGWGDPNQGMALRDYFAAAAMQGEMCAGVGSRRPETAELSAWAYMVADSMIAARDGSTASSSGQLINLVQRAQAILGAHLPPDGASEKETIDALLGLLDGPEARAALKLAGAA